MTAHDHCRLGPTVHGHAHLAMAPMTTKTPDRIPLPDPEQRVLVKISALILTVYSERTKNLLDCNERKELNNAEVNE